MSFAAATHSLKNAAGNYDMERLMRTDIAQWPSEERGKNELIDDKNIKFGKWLHSDMRDVAFLHVYKLYQQFINIGNLNEN